jgi:hypothetical protein
MDELAFRHDTFVDAAYEGLRFSRRRDLHGRALEALERRRTEGDGTLDAALALVLGFYFGSSASSRAQDETIRAVATR